MIRVPLTALLLLTMAACTPEAAENDSRAQEQDAPAEPGGAEAAAQEAGEGARAAVQAFHRALSEADSSAVLELLHPEAVIYESGHAETVEEYRSGHLPADIGFAASTEREVLEESSVVLDSGVLYLAETRVTGRMGEREIDSNGVETVVLAPEGDGWLIRHIHWSSR